jgi:phosphoribosylformylglycinamidine cyclo-ligase
LTIEKTKPKEDAVPTYLTYRSAGVDYGPLNQCKRVAQDFARKTTSNLAHHHGVSEVPGTRGESAYLVDAPAGVLSHSTEQPGTLILVADAMAKLTRERRWYRSVGWSTVAATVNDVMVQGALPNSINMALQAGDPKWFADTERFQELFRGWREACDYAQCAWGGGDTSVVPGIINPETASIVGSALGRVAPKWRRFKKQLRPGDAIVILESSGIHTNGLSLARRVAAALPDRYLTVLPNGRRLGEELLTPARIYVPCVRELQDEGIPVHYAVHVTGHGWRKLMRAVEPFTYRLDWIPEPPLIFDFLLDRGPIEDREAYATFNMGAGFALFLPPRFVDVAVRIARAHGINAGQAGTVEKGPKQVIIEPLGITYTEDELDIR